MRAISEVAAQELVWTQPSGARREHELRAGDELVATLRFERRSLAAAATAEGQWTFKRQGFWQPSVTVRVAGADADIAVFHPRWSGGGQLELQNGRQLRLSSANFWQTEWVWQDKEKPLVRFKGRHGIIKARGEVEIESTESAAPELPLLTVLGWYLILLYAEDMAASSAATVVAST